MAILRAFEKPADFNLPSEYKCEVYENDSKSFIKKISSEIERYDKYTIGKCFKKEFKFFNPTDSELIEETVTNQQCVIGQVYIPQEADAKTIFVVGSDSDALNEELTKFAGCQILKSEGIDIEILEKKSFSSGVVKLIGHQYNSANDTVSYKVRKIDGSYFRNQDPDFVSCDTNPKEVLEIRLNLADGDHAFFVYSEGKITRRGRDELNTPEFQLLKTAYDVIKQLTLQ